MINIEKYWAQINQNSKINWNLFLGISLLIGAILLEKSDNTYLVTFLRFNTLFISFGFIQIQRYKTLAVERHPNKLFFFKLYFKAISLLICLSVFIDYVIVFFSVLKESYVKTVQDYTGDIENLIIFTVLLILAVILSIRTFYIEFFREIILAILISINNFVNKLFTSNRVNNNITESNTPFYITEFLIVLIIYFVNSLLILSFIRYSKYF